MWLGILWGVGTFSRSFADAPPVCAPEVLECRITGPGGNVSAWKTYVLVQILSNKKFYVPAGWCASACVLAVGLALNQGAVVRISPRAVFQVHCRALFYAQPMPQWFRDRALSRYPAVDRGCDAHHS